MPNPPPPELKIAVEKQAKKLTLTETRNGVAVVLLSGNVVVGCDGSQTPSGNFVAGPWELDPTDPVFGPKPWKQEPWANPYGPYFLRLMHGNGTRTNYGIHGTRGPLNGVTGSFEKPPPSLKPDMIRALAKSAAGISLSDDDLKYLYCSHGCIRLSNQNIEKLFTLTNQAIYTGIQIKIVVS